MAVADAVLPSPPPPPPPELIVVVVLPSPPPPARIVVVVPALVRLPLVLRVAAVALIYLVFAGTWIMSAASAAQVVALRAWGDGSAPVLFLQAVMYGALNVCVCIILALLVLVVLLLCTQTQCVACVIAAVSGSTSGFKKSAYGAITRESVARFFRLLRPVVPGFLVDGAFFLLIIAGLLVEMMSPHVKGSVSQGGMVGSVIQDVGIFGMHATACFLIIPALILSVWREC